MLARLFPRTQFTSDAVVSLVHLALFRISAAPFVHIAQPLSKTFSEAVDRSEHTSEEAAPAKRGVLPPAEEIEAALAAEAGNVTRAAKRLGLHRNQLRRWMEKNARPL